MKRRTFISSGLCFLFATFAMKNLMYKKQISNLRMDNENMDVMELHGFSVATSSNCNLNCKYCSAYSPLAKNEYVEYEQYNADLLKLKEIAPDRNMNFVFVGGEPLLNPDFLKIFKRSYEIYPNSDAPRIILTNAVLLNEMDDNFWKTMKDCNADLRITRYPVNIDRKIYEEKAKKFGVKLFYQNVYSKKYYDIKTKEIIDYNYNQEGFDWGKNVLDLKGKQDYVEKRKSCPDRGVTTYARGNIYFCYVHAYIKSFIEYFGVDIPITKDDYIKISEVKNIKEIDDFLSSPKPLCRFCKESLNIYFGGQPKEWGFSKREITEWT